MKNSQASSAAPLVRASGLGVRRAGRWIFREVDLEVGRAKLVFLIGANGAGKTTCAKAVLGLADIDEGIVDRAPSLQVGYVPQRLAISPTLPLTMRRFIQLTGCFRGSEIDAALKAVGLDRLDDPPVTTLSGGEMQRLLLASALIRNPDLLVLDEPDQGVDVAGTEVLYTLIDGIRRNLGCGVLWISHNLELAMKAGDDFVVLVPHEHEDRPL
ncbi:MAG: ATP-binding cassette domain-containing protein [Nitrospinae bacterium]|nr:ATP-binding cassette domain-containing protein [Nitrospinota bacterium]